MEGFIFQFRRVLNDNSANKLTGLMVLLLGVLFVLGLFVFLLAPFQDLKNLAHANQKLIAEKSMFACDVGLNMKEKTTRQLLFAASKTELQKSIVGMLAATGLSQYDVRPAHPSRLGGDCFFEYELHSAARFGEVMRVFRELTKNAFYIKSFEIKNDVESGLFFKTMLLGYCGEMCQCDD